ncbi:MAG: hypothetical protein KC492_23620, partial [Myxococcales bacterium]|nr:hypothetical protein [Myxococcales bacterium]
VGPGPDGHIIDLYRVPCSGAPVEVYVDAYHCGPHVNAEAGVDIDHLSREELAGLAALIRHLHEDPVSEKASNRRKAAADFILATNQLHVELCGPLLQLLPQEERVPYYVGEFLLSMGAAVIEDGGEHPDPIEINMRTLDGVLVFYQAVLKQVGEGERQPSLDALLAKSKDRAAFQQFVTDTLNGCGGSNLGVEPGS